MKTSIEVSKTIKAQKEKKITRRCSCDYVCNMLNIWQTKLSRKQLGGNLMFTTKKKKKNNTTYIEYSQNTLCEKTDSFCRPRESDYVTPDWTRTRHQPGRWYATFPAIFNFHWFQVSLVHSDTTPGASGYRTRMAPWLHSCARQR